MAEMAANNVTQMGVPLHDYLECMSCLLLCAVFFDLCCTELPVVFCNMYCLKHAVQLTLRACFATAMAKAMQIGIAEEQCQVFSTMCEAVFVYDILSVYLSIMHKALPHLPVSLHCLMHASV